MASRMPDEGGPSKVPRLSAAGQMCVSIRALARKVMDEHGVEVRGELYDVPEMDYLNTMDVWNIVGDRRIQLSTKDVLATNVATANRIPEYANVSGVQSNFEHLWRLTEISEVEVSEFELTAKNWVSEKEITLTPTQLAMVIVLSWGPSVDTVRFTFIETCKKATIEVSKSLQCESGPNVRAFNWVTTTTGSGKSVVSLKWLMHAITFGWQSCIDGFPAWTNTNINGSSEDPELRITGNRAHATDREECTEVWRVGWCVPQTIIT